MEKYYLVSYRLSTTQMESGDYGKTRYVFISLVGGQQRGEEVRRRNHAFDEPHLIELQNNLRNELVVAIVDRVFYIDGKVIQEEVLIRK